MGLRVTKRCDGVAGHLLNILITLAVAGRNANTCTGAVASANARSVPCWWRPRRAGAARMAEQNPEDDTHVRDGAEDHQAASRSPRTAQQSTVR
jgi:hypothetical protein